MKTKDIDLIETLLDKNDYFFKKKKITEDDYIDINLNLIMMMEKFLRDEERKSIFDFLEDEFSLPKFKLSLAALSIIVN